MAFQVSKPSHNSRTKQIHLQIHELKSKLEAYRNSYLHFMYHSAAAPLYTDRHKDTQTHYHIHVPRLCMRTEA